MPFLDSSHSSSSSSPTVSGASQTGPVVVYRGLGRMIPACHPDRKHYAKARCKPCWRKMFYGTQDQRDKKKVLMARYYKAHRERINETTFRAMVKRVYKMSLEEYKTRMLNPCEICKGKATDMDHSHKTNTVRGVLCRSCNRGLGFFKDNALNLKRAIDYVVKYSDIR